MCGKIGKQEKETKTDLKFDLKIFLWSFATEYVSVSVAFLPYLPFIKPKVIMVLMHPLGCVCMLSVNKVGWG